MLEQTGPHIQPLRCIFYHGLHFVFEFYFNLQSIIKKIPIIFTLYCVISTFKFVLNSLEKTKQKILLHIHHLQPFSAFFFFFMFAALNINYREPYQNIVSSLNVIPLNTAKMPMFLRLNNNTHTCTKQNKIFSEINPSWFTYGQAITASINEEK